MGIEVKGKIYAIFETKKVSERFSKREFVVELADNPKYPQLVLFQATGDRCQDLDAVEEGDEVAIEFSLRGREWRSPSGEIKYFNSLDCWRVEKVGAPAARPRGGKQEPAPTRDSHPNAPGGGGGGFDGDDDIPFCSCDHAHEPSPIARCIR